MQPWNFLMIGVACSWAIAPDRIIGRDQRGMTLEFFNNFHLEVILLPGMMDNISAKWCLD